ncbi:MAG TPA: helix-turn-helix domain-containing protein [Draconibacterium sp.]|nr:helix-turn-helix domain-containing protein [Draconibacterium sp.]
MIEFIEPNNILRKYIKNYCIVEINSSMDFLRAEKVFPNGNICFVLHYGSPSKVKKGDSKAYIEPNLVVCGQQTSYYDLALAGKTGIILIVFKPHGLRAFFNLPTRELQNENISLDLLIKSGAGELEDKLLNSKDNKQRITYIEEFLTRKLIVNSNFDRIDYAIRLIESSKGQIKTHQISQEVCLGIKQFERIFSDYVGLNPKKYSSIIRFQNAIKMKRECKELTMYQLAFDSGYYDQSHFIHDFKSLTGLTPRDFFNNK